MSDEPVDANASSHINSMSALFYPRDKNIHLFYRAIPGTLYDVYSSGGKWSRKDLTKAAEAPPASGKPTALMFEYRQNSKGIFGFYRANDKHTSAFIMMGPSAIFGATGIWARTRGWRLRTAIRPRWLSTMPADTSFT